MGKVLDWFKNLFHIHNFKEYKFEPTSTSICACFGWKMFHDVNSQFGNCGYFVLHPDYKNYKICECGYKK